MYFITTLSSITHQSSFNEENVWDKLTPLTADSQLQSPDYKTIISPAELRRLTPVLRMAIACARACETQSGKAFDAISIGTSLGCLTDTEKFLQVVNTATGDILSPSSFIRSTHNTIAGQVSLELKNHAYNMTHTQNNLSFEVALIDAMMCCDEGAENVLAGASDEAIEFLNLLSPSIFSKERQLTSGTTFCTLSKQSNASKIGILDCKTIVNGTPRNQAIAEFLTKNEVTESELGLILTDQNIQMNTEIQQVNFLDYTGLHYSAVAFAVHIGHDWLLKHEGKKVLIVNESCPGNIGLTLLARNEA